MLKRLNLTTDIFLLQDYPLGRALQKGEDAHFDQVCVRAKMMYKQMFKCVCVDVAQHWNLPMSVSTVKLYLGLAVSLFVKLFRTPACQCPN